MLIKRIFADDSVHESLFCPKGALHPKQIRRSYGGKLSLPISFVVIIFAANNVHDHIV